MEPQQCRKLLANGAVLEIQSLKDDASLKFADVLGLSFFTCRTFSLHFHRIFGRQLKVFPAKIVLGAGALLLCGPNVIKCDTLVPISS